jgi:hypothetical protein
MSIATVTFPVNIPACDVVEVLGFGAVWICRSMSMIWRNMLPPSSGAEVTRKRSRELI